MQCHSFLYALGFTFLLFFALQPIYRNFRELDELFFYHSTRSILGHESKISLKFSDLAGIFLFQISSLCAHLLNWGYNKATTHIKESFIGDIKA